MERAGAQYWLRAELLELRHLVLLLVATAAEAEEGNEEGSDASKDGNRRAGHCRVFPFFGGAVRQQRAQRRE